MAPVHPEGAPATKRSLPQSYSAEKALELFQYSCGLAYDTSAGRSYEPFRIHPDGGFLYKLEANELVVVFRGTITEWGLNLMATEVSFDSLFDANGSKCSLGSMFGATVHNGYSQRCLRYFSWMLVR